MPGDSVPVRKNGPNRRLWIAHFPSCPSRGSIAAREDQPPAPQNAGNSCREANTAFLLNNGGSDAKKEFLLVLANVDIGRIGGYLCLWRRG
jgi:hypothetical protein